MSKDKPNRLPGNFDTAAIQKHLNDLDQWDRSRAELERSRIALATEVAAMEADTEFPAESKAQTLLAKREQMSMCDARIERCKKASADLLNKLSALHLEIRAAVCACSDIERDERQERFAKAVEPFMMDATRAAKGFALTDYSLALHRTTHGFAEIGMRHSIEHDLAALERFQRTGSILNTEGRDNWRKMKSWEAFSLSV